MHLDQTVGIKICIKTNLPMTSFEDGGMYRVDD